MLHVTGRCIRRTLEMGIQNTCAGTASVRVQHFDGNTHTSLPRAPLRAWKCPINYMKGTAKRLPRRSVKNEL